MNASQLINATSGNQEYFTPIELIRAARACMGSIELDPASCAEANKVVGASRIFTKVTNGLDKDWDADTIWVNWPFGKGEKACSVPHCKKKVCPERGYHIHEDVPGNADWVNKIVEEYEDSASEQYSDTNKQILCICYAATSEKWIQPLLRYSHCLLYPRTNYRLPDGSVKVGSQKGSMITYLGTSMSNFYNAFNAFGTIWMPYERL